MFIGAWEILLYMILACSKEFLRLFSLASDRADERLCGAADFKDDYRFLGFEM